MLDSDALADVIAELVGEHVERATAPLIAENAALAARIAKLEVQEPLTGPAGRDGRDGIDGRDADPDEVKRLVDEALAAAISALPPPEPGAPGKDGRDGADGKDGVGLAGALIDREGNLHLTLTDGTTRALGPVVGKDGRDGADGKDGRDGADGKGGVGLAGALIDREGNLHLTLTDDTTRVLGPVVGKDGRDGADGKDGRDGFSLDAFDSKISPDGRTLTLSFGNGQEEYVHEMTLPVPIYRGIWRDGDSYAPGDMVTWAGSLWHADKTTDAKPDSGEWTLVVKRGRDGKDKA